MTHPCREEASGMLSHHTSLYMLYWSSQHALHTPTLPPQLCQVKTVVYCVSKPCNIIFVFYHPWPLLYFLLLQIQRKQIHLNNVLLDCLNGLLALVHSPGLSAWREPRSIISISLSILSYTPSHSASFIWSSTLTIHKIFDIKGKQKTYPV